MDDTLLILSSMLGATLRISVPLILCAMAGVLSERAGVIDIGLEGKLLAAAFAAAATGAWGAPAGVALLAKFQWLIYVFGALLIWSGLKLLWKSEQPLDPEQNPIMRLCRRWLPIWP